MVADVLTAVALLQAGGLIGLPTETVYGLAADAENRHAVARIYAVKGRPAAHPLIVHLAPSGWAPSDDLGDNLAGWVRDVPDYAHHLAERGWPGPLTLVLPRGPRAGDHVTGGQDTVAIRIPNHPTALAVLEAFGGGLAAPSANRFGRVSPTNASAVLEELAAGLTPGRDGVLDGGASAVGLESTIIDCTGPGPRILRPGAVTKADVESWCGLTPAQGPVSHPSPRAPGTLAAHYAPTARVLVVEAGSAALDQALSSQGAGRVGLLAPATMPTPPGVVRLAAPAKPLDYARDLYSALRRADALALALIVAVPPMPIGVGVAVRDRLARAAAGSHPATCTLLQ